MMFDPALRVLALVVLAGAAAVDDADTKILLKPRFTTGQTFYLEVSQDVSQKTTGGRWGDEGIQMMSEYVRTGKVTVDSVSETQGVKGTVVFDRMMRSSTSPMMSLSFDSDSAQTSDEKNVLSQVFKPMIGASIKIDIDKDGRVRSCKGMDAVLDKIEDAVAGKWQFEQLRDDLSDDTARVVWADSHLALYANKEVKPGDTWTRTIPYTGIQTGKLEYEYHCRLDRLEKKDGRSTAFIAYEATLRRLKDAPTPPSVMGMVADLSEGRIQGTATYDIDRGLIVVENEDSMMVINSTGPGPTPDQPMKMRSERRVKQAVKVLSEEDRAKQRAAAAAAPKVEQPK